MRIRPPKLLPLALLLSLCAPPCFARSQSRDYLPLTGAETARRFPVRYLGTPGYSPSGLSEGVRSVALPGRIGVGPSGARVEMSEEGRLAIAGEDRGGAAWSVRLGNMALPNASRFYAADFDRDGVTDLVVFFPTGGSGLAPTGHLFFLTFDGRGRPAPFEVEGYFQLDERGMLDLLDLDGDRRAELVHMNHGGGYWVTNLYEAEGGGWRKVAGRHARRSYPLYTRFTRRPNRNPVAPRPGARPFAPDLSTASPVLSGALVSYEWADVGQSEDVKLTVSAGGREVECSPVSWYGSFGLVADAPRGREVVSAYGNEGRVRELLDEAVKSGSAASLYGRRDPSRCSPEWVWLQR